MIIPARKFVPLHHTYGDAFVAAAYCGLPSPPSPVPYEWTHGWLPPEYNVHPELVVGSDGRSQKRKDTATIFVAREDQRTYLASQGYKKVRAIGHPIVYLTTPAVTRMPRSLLVMPGHSLPEMIDDLNEDEYVAYIISVAPRFSRVVVCLHQHCIDKGNWVEPFRKRGIEVVAGAQDEDANTYLRMAALFSQFEFVTTNMFGSHVAYASLYGAKVSVSGPMPDWKRECREGLVIYRNAPELLDVIETWHRDKIIERAHPQFICEPDQAQENVAWARVQLGMDKRLSPKELKKLFRWTKRDAFMRMARRWARNVFRAARLFGWFLRARLSVRAFLGFNRIFTHLTLEEKLCLHKVARCVQPGTILAEIGSYLGASACFLAAGMASDCLLYCIDTWGNDAMAYTEDEKRDRDLQPKDTYAEFLANTAPHKARIVPLRGWSTEVVGKIPRGPIGGLVSFLFVDGDHSYTGVLADWNAYFPLLSPQAFVAFHDTGWADGVNRVIQRDVEPIATLVYDLPNMKVFQLNPQEGRNP